MLRCGPFQHCWPPSNSSVLWPSSNPLHEPRLVDAAPSFCLASPYMHTSYVYLSTAAEKHLQRTPAALHSRSM